MRWVKYEEKVQGVSTVCVCVYVYEDMHIQYISQ
uniref:Uncharacterized protein n=1 Tax=Anguilla anguilla TaxID=7936 RepID=A0A0E9T254_ANGAN